MPPGRTPEQQLETAERRKQVVEWRRDQVSFAEIGERLGVSAPRAYQIYQAALKEIPAQQVHEHRSEQVGLIENQITRLAQLAETTTDVGEIVKITNAIRNWLERKARLLGLDMPTVNVNIEGGKVNYRIDGVDMDKL